VLAMRNKLFDVKCLHVNLYMQLIVINFTFRLGFSVVMQFWLKGYFDNLAMS